MRSSFVKRKNSSNSTTENPLSGARLVPQLLLFWHRYQRVNANRLLFRCLGNSREQCKREHHDFCQAEAVECERMHTDHTGQQVCFVEETWTPALKIKPRTTICTNIMQKYRYGFFCSQNCPLCVSVTKHEAFVVQSGRTWPENGKNFFKLWVDAWFQWYQAEFCFLSCRVFFVSLVTASGISHVDHMKVLLNYVPFPQSRTIPAFGTRDLDFYVGWYFLAPKSIFKLFSSWSIPAHHSRNSVQIYGKCSSQPTLRGTWPRI